MSPLLLGQRALVVIAALTFLSQFYWRSGGPGVANSIVIFTLAWWVIFFMLLPVGVRSQTEGGDVVEGSEPGAPIQPMLKKKAWWTTVSASGFWLAAFIVTELELIPLP